MYLGYRQRVHVGAQPDGATVALAAADDADHAGARDAGDDLVAAEFLELLRDEVRRLEDVEIELRIAGADGGASRRSLPASRRLG